MTGFAATRCSGTSGGRERRKEPALGRDSTGHHTPAREQQGFATRGNNSRTVGKPDVIRFIRQSARYPRRLQFPILVGLNLLLRYSDGEISPLIWILSVLFLPRYAFLGAE